MIANILFKQKAILLNFGWITNCFHKLNSSKIWNVKLNLNANFFLENSNIQFFNFYKESVKKDDHILNITTFRRKPTKRKKQKLKHKRKKLRRLSASKRKNLNY